MTQKKEKLLSIQANNGPIKGKVELGGSKSISNRALIIQALCKEAFTLDKISDSKDTQTLITLLNQKETVFDAGHAGTCFRFMTAFLALQNGSQILTGSKRMKERPIGPLVNALLHLGADIEYVEKEGYPPLKINTPKATWKSSVHIDGTMSSQFITALILIAPSLPNGLEINIIGSLVSVPYVEMTLNMLHYFGIEYAWELSTIKIKHQAYKAKDLTIEADWSSASYLYSLVAINPGSNIQIKGLFQESLQGDSEIQHFIVPLGVSSHWKDGVLTLQHEENHAPVFEYNFIRQPDLAQSIACICAAKGITGLFTGLKTLFIKETNRVLALKNELSKVEVSMTALPAKFTKDREKEDVYLIEGKFTSPNLPFETYQDHRMAMAFSSFACLSPIEIINPSVVVKSFPDYWTTLEKLGFNISLP